MNGTHQFLSSSFFFPSNQRKTRKLLCKLNWAHVPVTNSHVRPATCQHKVIFVLLNYSQCKLMRCLGLSCFHKRNSQIICVICFGEFFFSCLFHGDGGFSLFIERPVRVRENYFAHLNGLLHRL